MKPAVNPVAKGSFLSAGEIDKAAAKIYDRFYYEYGMRIWPDVREDIKVKLRKQVKEVLDVLEINEFKVVKAPRKVEG